MTHPGPLSGIRVTDLTATFMGPYCTQILADMGADVIKIEPPSGDTTRYVSVGPEPAMAGVFVNVNRGKRSAVLDLRTAGDKETLRRIAGRTDVFIHSMRAAAIGRLGFGYEDVAALNPPVVYVNCYGFGRRGTDAGRVAYDDIIQAESGMVAAQEKLTGEASYAGTIMADKISGLTAVYATMMALFHRERTGEGQEVEVPMFETMASFMLAEHASGALFTPPLGPAAYPRPVAPNRKPYRTTDGHISALVYSDKQWAAFTGAVRPSWDSAEFATLEQRSRQIDTVYGLLGKTFASRTTQEWLDLLRSLDIPCAPVRSLDELFDSEHLNSAGFFQTVEGPYGPVRFPGPPAWFSRTPGRIDGPAPRLGEHTEQVRAEAGGDTVGPHPSGKEACVFEAEDIREWCGRAVVDSEGAKIGELAALYVDTRTDQFSFASVKTGHLSRARLVFVPIGGATVGPGYLKVSHPKKRVKDAPSIDTDGELLAADEPAVFRHYDLPYEAGETERLLARR